MTTLPKELFVFESPKTLAFGEARPFSVNFTKLGTPDSAGTTLAYKSNGDSASAMLSGSNTISGDIVTMQKFTPTAADSYRLVASVTIGGSAAYGIVQVEVLPIIPATYAVGVNSYGSAIGVAAYVPRYANKSGSFDDTTRPSLKQLVAWIDQVSAILNAMLASEGFTIPLTDTDAVAAVKAFVEQEIASMVEGVNGSGRFGPTGKRSKSRWELLNEDARAFIQTFYLGLERLGAARSQSIGSEIGYRKTHATGDEVPPLFQREAFNERYQDWDT